MDSTPENLNDYYDSSDKWEEAKAAMMPYHEDRTPRKYLEENYPKRKAEGRFLPPVIWFGFDVAHAHMIGTENVFNREGFL